MWEGKKKAITFSFDDGVTQDIRAIAIMDKYGLKGTFNLNSSLLGLQGEVHYNNRPIPHNKVQAAEVRDIYAGHEVAVHTMTHPNLTTLVDDTIVYQVEGDRRRLSNLCGYEVIGMAYPCGGVNNDERVAKVIKDNTPVAYARTITSTYTFELQKENLLRFNPTVHFVDKKAEEIVQKFLALETDKPQLLYIWGHCYEMDFEPDWWERFENLCKMLSGKEDIFYGTNKEVLL